MTNHEKCCCKCEKEPDSGAALVVFLLIELSILPFKLYFKLGKFLWSLTPWGKKDKTST